MRTFGRFSFTLWSLAALAAQASLAATFDKYLAKSISSAPLKLDDVSYEELTATPRNHTTIILLTALEARYGCQLCRDFQAEWEVVGKSWVKGDRAGDTRVLYGTLDFTDGKRTFQKVLRRC